MTNNEPKAKRGHRGGLLVLVGVLAAGGLAAEGVWSRSETVSGLQKTADDASLPRVEVVSPKPGPRQRTLTLPGNIDAWYQAPIYAQVSGYVSHWYKDYGAEVKTGDVLASIDTPALDAQFAASKANLAVMQARYKLAVITTRRWSALAGTQAVSQQEVDVKAADAAAQKAQVEAAQQDVARYQALIVFKQLVAPFDGVVTARNTNVGDYVNAAGGDATLPSVPPSLFVVADIHQMRIFVSVPQEYADVLKPGLTATLTLPQAPDKPIQAQFRTTAHAVVPSTRTIVTELTADNANRELWPGTYASVHFTFPGEPNLLILPEQALLFRTQGMQVAVVDDQDRVHLRDVTLGKNLDTEVQIVSGLKATDKVVGNPSLGLLDGQQVKPVQPVAGYQPGQGHPRVQPFALPPAGRMTPGGSASRLAQPEPVTTAASVTTDVDRAPDPPDGLKTPDGPKMNVGPSP
jgi:membrane fusion protein (multidrug efflux system)